MGTTFAGSGRFQRFFDDVTIPAFEVEGLSAFTYATKNGEHKLTSYWRMPDRLYDDPQELAQWARAAHARTIT